MSCQGPYTWFHSITITPGNETPIWRIENVANFFFLKSIAEMTLTKVTYMSRGKYICRKCEHKKWNKGRKHIGKFISTLGKLHINNTRLSEWMPFPTSLPPSKLVFDTSSPGAQGQDSHWHVHYWISLHFVHCKQWYKSIQPIIEINCISHLGLEY